MHCGFWENDITPLLGMNLPGYFVLRPATQVLDRLFVRAMAIESHHAGLILISADCLYVTREMTRAVRDRIREKLDIDPACILFCATHTHTGGPLLGSDTDDETAPRPYADFLCARAADAAILAWQARVPARIGFAAGREAALSFNRRYLLHNGQVRTNPGFQRTDIAGPAGLTDADVGVIRIDNPNGQVIGVITNYACHCDTISGNGISADFPGELHRIIKKVYGDHVVSMFITGACGDVNHVDYLHADPRIYQDPERPYYQTMGRILAGDVIRTAERINTSSVDLPLVGLECAFTARIRQPDADNVRAAQTYLAEHPFIEHRIYNRTDPWPCEEAYFARSLLNVASQSEKSVPVSVQVMRIGELALVALPCELFTAFGLEIKRRASGHQVILATLANDCQGYIASREAFDQGGYETRICGQTRLVPETGEQMVSLAEDMLNQVFMR